MTSHLKWTDEQRAEIVDEMNRVLIDKRFLGSKRCSKLLSRLVELSLSSECYAIKERTLGIEVFGRDAQYDTNADPIVRATASEIRKRLAQIYQEPNPSQRVRIQLVPGSYLPVFEFDRPNSMLSPGGPERPVEAPDLVVRFPQEDAAGGKRQDRFHLFKKWRVVSAAAFLLLLGAAFLLIRSDLFHSTQYLIWKPLLGSGDPLIICVADDHAFTSAKDEDRAQLISNVIASRIPIPVADSPSSIPATPFVDANVASQIASWLAAHGTQSGLRRASRLTLQDFRQRPAVLIGGFENPWSLILLSNLRFKVHIDPATKNEWIEDAQNPGKREWMSNSAMQYAGSFIDYALITRFYDRETGNWIVALGGLGLHGTKAASELITDPSFAKSLPASLRSKANFQIVLKTTVISGTTSPPQILAVHVW